MRKTRHTAAEIVPESNVGPPASRKRPPSSTSRALGAAAGATQSSDQPPGSPPCSPRPTPQRASSHTYNVSTSGLAKLGGGWSGAPPYVGGEEGLYRWIAEPTLWARVLAPVEQRLRQLHVALHDALDASGFVLWRAFPPLHARLTVVLRQASVPPSRLELQRVTIRQAKLQPSSRFGPDWEMRSFPSAAAKPPAWMREARQVASP